MKKDFLIWFFGTVFIAYIVSCVVIANFNPISLSDVNKKGYVVLEYKKLGQPISAKVDFEFHLEDK